MTGYRATRLCWGARYKVSRRGRMPPGVPARRLFCFSAAPLHLLREGNPMLVLSRKLHESIIINDNILVTIVEIKGDRVRLGITAPPEVRVDREEVARRLQEFVGPQ